MRKPIEIQQLREISEQLTRAAARIAEAVKLAETAGMPKAILHWDTAANRYIPKVCDWAVAVDKDVARAVEAFVADRPSPGEQSQTAYRARSDRAQGR
jgi:hypothetical protein